MGEEKKVKIAIVQMEIKGDMLEPACKMENLKHAEDILDRLCDEKPDLVVLPEDFYCGYAYGPMNIPDFITVNGYERLGEKAKKGGFYIAGTACVPPEKPKDYRTHICGFVIDPAGKVVLSQHLFNPMKKSKHFVIPGEKISVLETPFGTLGIVVGMDLFYPEVARALALSGADILLCPILMVDDIPGLAQGNYAYDTMKLSQIIKSIALTRAFENQCHFVVASAVGEYVRAEGRPLMGMSFAAGPQGIIAKTDSAHEELLMIELNREPLQIINNFFGFLECRQPVLDNLLTHRTAPINNKEPN